MGKKHLQIRIMLDRKEINPELYERRSLSGCCFLPIGACYSVFKEKYVNPSHLTKNADTCNKLSPASKVMASEANCSLKLPRCTIGDPSTSIFTVFAKPHPHFCIHTTFRITIGLRIY